MLDAGSQLTLASLRHEFWILWARTTIRSVLYKCILCMRERADVPNQTHGRQPSGCESQLAPLSTPALITQVWSLSELPIEGINRKRPHFRMPHDQTLRARQRLYLYLYRSNDLFLAEDYVFRSMYFTAPIANPMHMQKQLAILTSETRYRRNCMAFPILCVTAFRRSVGGQR